MKVTPTAVNRSESGEPWCSIRRVDAHVETSETTQGCAFVRMEQTWAPLILEEQELNLLQRRRNRDPYAESFRERHAVGINAIKRWAKRIIFVAALYGYTCWRSG